jgi:DeoR/GlpR family transcriptional regulator of sugar metabolism
MSSVLTTQRKQFILSRLERDRQVIAKVISAELKLSEDTIRRDLRELAQEGLLQRVHGGALPSSPAMADFAGRETLASEAKRAIGRAATAMIQPGQVAILDGGTTAREVARQLLPGLRATIVTHSPTIAVALASHPGVEVILIGGRLFKHSVVSVGAAAIESIGRIRADIYFMGVTGIHAKRGLSTGDFEECHVKRAWMNAAAETIVLASPEKLNTASPHIIAGMTDIDGMIVPGEVSDETLAPYRDLGVAITKA